MHRTRTEHAQNTHNLHGISCLLLQQPQSWLNFIFTEYLWPQRAAPAHLKFTLRLCCSVQSYFQTNFKKKKCCNFSLSYFLLWHLVSIFHKNEQELSTVFTMHTVSPAGYPSSQTAPAVSQQPYPGTYAIIQPSVVVVGGCPACRWGLYTSSVVLTGKAFVFGNLACEQLYSWVNIPSVRWPQPQTCDWLGHAGSEGKGHKFVQPENKWTEFPLVSVFPHENFWCKVSTLYLKFCRALTQHRWPWKLILLKM